MNFQWRVDAIDLEGDWGWRRATIEVLFRKIIPRPENRWTKLELAAYGVGATGLTLLIELACFS